MESHRSGAEAGKEKEENTGYQRKGGVASTTGQDYEVAICSLIFLRALRLSSDFYLACNYKLAGKFDDAVLFYRLDGDPEHQFRAILLQAKHKARVTAEELTVKSPFNLTEYLESFNKNKQLWEGPLMVDERLITFKYITIALFTNTGCEVGEAACDVTDRPEMQQLQEILNTEGRLLRIADGRRVGLPKRHGASDFLGQLLLCVNQMNVAAADKFLQEELRRSLRLRSTDFASQLTSELKSLVKTWWSDEGRGRYLTPHSEEWKKILELQVKRLNNDTLTHSRNLNLGFTAAALEEFHVVQRRTGKTWITVKDTYQASVTRVRFFRAQKNSLVLGAEYLERHWEEVETLWGRTFCPALVLDLTNYPEHETSNLLQRLQYAAETDATRHLIVLDTKQPQSEGWHVVAPQATWSALDDDTQERLVTLNVQLQGTGPVELRDIIGSHVSDVMTEGVIRLLSGSSSAIKLGEKMPPPLEYYVPRCLRRTSSKNISIVSLEYTNALIFPTNNLYPPYSSFISGAKLLSPLDLQENDNVEGLAILRGINSESDIRNLCCKFGVKGFEGELEKKGFRGEVTEYIPFPWICEDKVIAVEGVPGVGKSSFMTAMCSRTKEQFPEAWVLRVDMRKHSEVLREAHFTRRDDVIEFLLNGISKDLQSLERQLLKHSLAVTGNVFLFLDAFDEISPEFTVKCCDLLRGIAHGVRFRQLVVTTRPVTRKDVEEALETQAFTLPAFSRAEQTQFLKQFSTTDGKKVLQSEITSLRESAGPVIEIPLLCKMVAEVLFNRQDQSLLQYKDPWRRVLLYKLFVEQRVRHNISEKLDLQASIPGRKTFFANTLKQHFLHLQGLAVRKLIPVDNVSNLDVSREVPDAILGLVVDTGESVDFEHRTFAEFFLGCWLSENWRQCPRQFLRDVLNRDGFDFVSATLSWSLFEGFPRHVAVARGDRRAVEDQLGSGTVDHGGRSALDVAALTAENIEVSELLVASAEDLNKRDEVLGATAARYAEVTGNWELVELILQHGATLEGLNFIRDENLTREVLIVAVEKDLLRLLLNILNMNNSLLHRDVDVKRNTLLHIAASSNCVRVMKLLIEMEHVINVRNSEGNTPLHEPSIQGSVEAVRLLVDNGADPNIENEEGETPLKIAIRLGNLDIVKIFTESIFETEKESKYAESAMMTAASEGQLGIINFLIEKGVDIHAKDKDGKTALILAARRNHLEVVELLINSGDRRNIKGEDGRAALASAAREGHSEMVKLLERNIIADYTRKKCVNVVATKVGKRVTMTLQDILNDKDSETEDRQSVLSTATFQDHLELVKVLILGGMNLNANEAEEFSWSDLKGHLHVVRALGGKGGGGSSPDGLPLALAAFKGHTEVMKLLTKVRGDLSLTDRDGETALTWAAGEGHGEIVALLLDNGAEMNITNTYSDSPLILAARKGHEQVAKLLIDCGADLDLRDENGDTALTLAAKEGRLQVLRVMMESVTETTRRQEYMEAAFTAAVRASHMDIVKFLLEIGFITDVRSKSVEKAFLVAAGAGHAELVRLLMDRGIETDARDERGNTALMLAAVEGHEEVLETLVKNGVRTNTRNKYGDTALTLAAAKGHAGAAKILTAGGVAEINTKNREGETALTLAAREGHLDLVRVLIESGADTNVTNFKGRHALILAAMKGHLRVVKLLLEKGLDVNLKDDNGDSALTWAAYYGRLNVVKLLVENGFEANAKNNYGNDAFTVAAAYGHLEVVTYLTGRGMGDSVKDVNGYSALTWAAINGHVSTVKMLLDKGFDANLKDNYGDSPLTWAACNGHLDVVEALAENRCELNAKNVFGDNAFTLAAFNGHLGVVKFLTDVGVEDCVRNIYGSTALTLAAAEGHLGVVKFLLKKGFDVNVKDNDGDSAMTLAKSNGHLDVVKLLHENGGEVKTKNKNGKTALNLAKNVYTEIEKRFRKF